MRSKPSESTMNNLNGHKSFKPEEAYEREDEVWQIFVIFGRAGRRKLGQFCVSRRGRHSERDVVKLPRHRSAK